MSPSWDTFRPKRRRDRRENPVLNAAFSNLLLVRPMFLAMFNHVAAIAWIGFAQAIAFGLWWLLTPLSVLRFYSRLAKRDLTAAKPLAVGLVGFGWIVMLVAVFW
jgi:hypothetical protein